VKGIKWLSYKFNETQVLQANQNNALELADENDDYQEFQEPLVALGPNN